jgi:hypothetical protein
MHFRKSPPLTELDVWRIDKMSKKELVVQERFEWITPEFTVENVGPNKMRVKGIAAHGNQISKNGRRYVVDELRRAARTWIGKKVTQNHDPTRILGDVKWAEYSDASDALECLLDINNPQIVHMIRDKSATIRGLSIEAAYTHNICPDCAKIGKEIRFYDEPSFHRHMAEEHFKKASVLEPHGIYGQAISIVTSPEQPGMENTAIFETQNGFNKLCETVLQNKPQESNLTEKQQRPILYDPLTQPKEFAESVKRQVEENVLIVPVPKGYPLEIDAKEINKIVEPCSPELKACVDALIADGKEESSAWAICKAKLGETIDVQEIAKIFDTHLSEPFKTLWQRFIGQTDAHFKEVEANMKELQNYRNHKPIVETLEVDKKQLKESLSITEMKLQALQSEHKTLQESYAKQEKALTLLENAEWHLHPEFKGRNKNLKQQNPVLVDPLTGR